MYCSHCYSLLPLCWLHFLTGFTVNAIDAALAVSNQPVGETVKVSLLCLTLRLTVTVAAFHYWPIHLWRSIASIPSIQSIDNPLASYKSLPLSLSVDASLAPLNKQHLRGHFSHLPFNLTLFIPPNQVVYQLTKRITAERNENLIDNTFSQQSCLLVSSPHINSCNETLSYFSESSYLKNSIDCLTSLRNFPLFKTQDIR